MKPAPIPANEKERLRALAELALLDTPSEERFDRLTRLAAEKLRAPMAAVSLIDENREWFKSGYGLKTKEGRRAESFCGHAMLARVIFVLEDTLKDERFADNPQVIGPPFVRSYAGIALYNREKNLPVGVLCVKDIRPRVFSAAEISSLVELAALCEEEINSGKKN